jgi:hypothetical protein
MSINADHKTRSGTYCIGKVFESNVKFLDRVVTVDSRKDLSNAFSNLTEQARVIGAVHTDLSLDVEELAIEQRAHLRRFIPRDEHRLTQEFGSTQNFSHQREHTDFSKTTYC